MKVWIVWTIYRGEGEVLDVIFDSKDKAEDFVKRHYKREGDYRIEEKTVNQIGE